MNIYILISNRNLHFWGYPMHINVLIDQPHILIIKLFRCNNDLGK